MLRMENMADYTVALTATFLIIAIDIHVVFSIISSLFVILFFIARIKRWIENYHNGSFWEYIKWLFSGSKGAK